jgi:transcriptional regulator with XRE-family HTH domain
MKVVTEQDARQNISANLRRILHDRGIKQTDLARMSGEPDMAISRLLRGQNTPTATLLAHVAEALDVSMDRLMSPPPKKNFPMSA